MATVKYIVQGEPYYGPDHNLYVVGSEVFLPESGRHSVPPPGWIHADSGEPVSHDDHKLMTAERVAQEKAEAVAAFEAKKAARAKATAEKAKPAAK